MIKLKKKSKIKLLDKIKISIKDCENKKKGEWDVLFEIKSSNNMNYNCYNNNNNNIYEMII